MLNNFECGNYFLLPKTELFVLTFFSFVNAALLSSLIFIISILTLSLENLCGGRFHQHLRDTFAPQVVRYVDLMESSIAQSLHKGYEKERWELKGYLNILYCFLYCIFLKNA